MTKQLARTAAAVVMTTAMAWNVPVFAQAPASSRGPATRPTTTTALPAQAPAIAASTAASAPPPSRGHFGPGAAPAPKPRS